METKVNNFQKHNPIPAGVISGWEAFWDEKTKTKWLAIDGIVKPFNQWPAKIQNQIVKIFLDDTDSIEYLRKKGITAFSQSFDRWYKCVVGGFDGEPDFVNNKLFADTFNNTCQDLSCQDRGKFCGKASMLKNFEVETIQVLSKGHTITQAAGELRVSVPATKKRIEQINLKLETRNMASMIATSSCLGII